MRTPEYSTNRGTDFRIRPAFRDGFGNPSYKRFWRNSLQPLELRLEEPQVFRLVHHVKARGLLPLLARLGWRVDSESGPPGTLDVIVTEPLTAQG